MWNKTFVFLDVLRKNLPTGAGQRNQCLFHLAQDLLEFLPGDTPSEDLLVIGAKWYACALPVIQTKDILESIADFLIAWKNVRWPKGTAWAAIVAEAKHDDFTLGGDLNGLDLTARILRVLSRRQGGGPFPLSSRKLAGAIGAKDPKTALSTNERTREAPGYVVVVKKGEPKPRGQATVWQWNGPLD